MRNIWQVNNGFDETGHERRQRGEGTVDCPTCGRAVSMDSETAAWVEDDAGRWAHSEFGDATGECCGLLIVGSFDGCRAFSLKPAAPDDRQRNVNE